MIKTTKGQQAYKYFEISRKTKHKLSYPKYYGNFEY